MQRPHPAGPVIHSLAAGGDGVRRWHPSALADSARPPGRGEPAAQPRELTVKDGKGGVVEVVPLRRGPRGLLSQSWSHSPPSAAVHQ